MATQLGFMVIPMDRQFVGQHVEEAKHLEVHNELHFKDITLGNGPSLRVRDRLKAAVRERSDEFAQRWERTVSDTRISTTLRQLSHPRDRRTRAALTEVLKDLVVDNGWGEGWPTG